jgi:16S rRNA (cytidine1402-2'-O)-methyltransferase
LSAKPIGGGGVSKREAALLVVATPIGNLDDVTTRALRALREADLIACEDTRTTAKLLAAHGIGTATTPYHDHNAERARPKLLKALEDGRTVALVSDAGTPLVADPGFKLVREAIARGIRVIPIPGPSAALAALVVSGLPSDRFLFAGFLPATASARKTALRELAAVPATLVFFESPQRLAESLAAMAAVLGDRQAAVARELTKLFEETQRGSLSELAARYGIPPKGEVVVVVGPPIRAEASDEEIDHLLEAALQRESVRDAAAAVAEATGRPKRDVYGRALALAGKRG